MLLVVLYVVGVWSVVIVAISVICVPLWIICVSRRVDAVCRDLLCTQIPF